LDGQYLYLEAAARSCLGRELEVAEGLGGFASTGVVYGVAARF
jgi:hypothetical protein